MATVFDYVPRGTAPVFPESVIEAMQSTLDAGGDATETYDAMADAEVRALREDPTFAEALHEAYRDAGVDLVSPSIGRMHYEEIDQRHANHVDLTRWEGRVNAVDWFVKVTNPGEARGLADNEQVGVILNTQNLGGAIAGDLDEVEHLANAGVRIAQLTYNQHNHLGSGVNARSDGRLSQLGVDAVDRLNDLGIVVDLSHCGTRTTLDAIEVSDAPVAATHSVCQALSGVERGQTDEEIETLAAVDGYMGIVTVPYFLAPEDPDRAFEAFFEHLEHTLDHMGADRVGIACDWGLWTPDVPRPIRQRVTEKLAAMKLSDDEIHVNMPFGPMETYTQRPLIEEGLRERGYTDAEIKGFLGENFLSFWERVELAA